MFWYRVGIKSRAIDVFMMKVKENVRVWNLFWRFGILRKVRFNSINLVFVNNWSNIVYSYNILYHKYLKLHARNLHYIIGHDRHHSLA